MAGEGRPWISSDLAVANAFSLCSKTVVVPCSKRVKLDHDGGNRRAGKRLKNQVE